jgi:hypothetical protein
MNDYHPAIAFQKLTSPCLDPDSAIKPSDCGAPDLNEFSS